MTIIEADLERDGNWWLAWITVDGERQGTQGKNLDEISLMATDLAKCWGVTEPVIKLVPTDDASKAALAARDAKMRAQKARESAKAAQVEAVKSLLSEGLTMRESGRLLGVSFQRVSQLAKS